MKKVPGLANWVRASFLVALVGGLLLFLITGNDVFARVGVTGAVIVILLWSTFLATRSVIQKLRARLYFDATTSVMWHGGILLLLMYFTWLLLWEMFGFQMFGALSPVKQSKLTILGASLILLALVVGLAAVPFRRKNASGRRE